MGWFQTLRLEKTHSCQLCLLVFLKRMNESCARQCTKQLHLMLVVMYYFFLSGSCQKHDDLLSLILPLSLPQKKVFSPPQVTVSFLHRFFERSQLLPLSLLSTTRDKKLFSPTLPTTLLLCLFLSANKTWEITTGLSVRNSQIYHNRTVG